MGCSRPERKKAPPDKITSPIAKFVVFSLQVNVRVRVISLVVEPLSTALLPSDAVIVILGPTLSAFATLEKDGKANCPKKALQTL